MYLRMPTFTKLIIFLIFSGILWHEFLVLRDRYFHFELKMIADIKKRNVEQKMKYILFEADSNASKTFTEGQNIFRAHRCPHFKCYMTMNKKKLERIEDFDAVVVNVNELDKVDLPLTRPEHQLYIFHGMEPPDHPLYRTEADNLFNYTWSYKLTSDIVAPFFMVKDENNTVVAPSFDVKWIKNKTIVRDDFLETHTKDKAVAVILQNCNGNSEKIYADHLKDALANYSQKIDFFGCKKGPIDDDTIAIEYYYVLVTATAQDFYSGSTAQDYVTDIVLKAFWNNAVPIIRANADLTKFLPPGSYIDANLPVGQVAAVIHYSTRIPTLYKSFFRWKKYYTFHRRREFEGVCELCGILHGGNSQHFAPNLIKWWGANSFIRKLKILEALNEMTEEV